MTCVVTDCKAGYSQQGEAVERDVYLIYIMDCQISKLRQHNIYFKSRSLHSSYSYTLLCRYKINKHDVLCIIPANVCSIRLVGKATDYICYPSCIS